jgi:hypothetical protein
MSGLMHRRKPHRYSITYMALAPLSAALCNLFKMQAHVEAERAASPSGALTHKEMRYGDIGCSEVRRKSVLEAFAHAQGHG